MESWTKNEIVGLFFYFLIFIVTIIAWYWICFRNGAQYWSNGISKYYKKIGMNFMGDFPLFKPNALKAGITIFLLALIIGFYLVVTAESFLKT